MHKNQRVRIIDRPHLSVSTAYVYDAPSKACIGAIQELTAGVYAVHTPYVTHGDIMALQPYAITASFNDGIEVLLAYDADELPFD